MKIVILAGGTGSIALQTGLYNTLESLSKDEVDIKILTNAYDNGLSTGSVRKVMGGRILGPSDVRKNQTTRLKLEQPESPWHKLLDIRFTSTSDKAEDFCIGEINKFDTALSGGREEVFKTVQPLRDAVTEYFRTPDAVKIDYNDFSLANIIYAGLAKQNGYSLRKAATIMARLMGIKDNVILNDDRSLFLGAITRSGVRVTDEGDIVCWGNEEDPFEDLFFVDHNGEDMKPTLCDEAKDAIFNADLIIMSSGTQWSSLIPTYASIGFYGAIAETDAKLLMVMNRQPDKDSPGQTPGDIIDLLTSSYMPAGIINLIIDTSGHVRMSSINGDSADQCASVNYFDMEFIRDGLSGKSPSKHNPYRLAHAVAKTYFGINDNIPKSIIFDYDDTLVGRGNKFIESSNYNIKGINVLNEKDCGISICTGNSVKALNLKLKDNVIDNSMMPMNFMVPDITVYADGGVNKYYYPLHYADEEQTPKFVRHLDDKLTLGRAEIALVNSRLREAHIPVSKIENRGDTVIALKPIDPEYRNSIIELLKYKFYINEIGMPNTWEITSSGRSTIEISKKGISKTLAVKEVLKNNPYSVFYVGDELDSGNDYAVKQLSKQYPNLRCIKVKSPAETAFLIHVLLQTFGVTILK
jgi:2-phospho-L-lactate transferase/gluconeogenesis factor (CofD/UPF0052 family)/hydroxymethylpyrimidine pyrophosphatase-like HAD family hydrolase